LEGDSKKVVIVGIPGVGKTTLVSRVVEDLGSQSVSVSMYSFGSIMFAQAQADGIADRDQLRKLPVSRQQGYQRNAAEQLSQVSDAVVLVDTHAFVSTPSGAYPGLPAPVLEILKPSFFISVIAPPEEIYARRVNDETRRRDKISIANIKKELSMQESMLATCSVMSGAPIKLVSNLEGKVDEAAARVVRAIGA